jgi:hypothetical protein
LVDARLERTASRAYALGDWRQLAGIIVMLVLGERLN